MFTADFWRATAQRVIRSFAAALSALLVADGTGIIDTAWGDRFSTAGMASVVTLLLCVAGDALTDGAGPAFGTVEQVSPPAPVVQD